MPPDNSNNRHECVSGYPDTESAYGAPGLTKLEYAAIHIMSARCVTDEESSGIGVAIWSVEMANRLFDQLDKNYADD